jgi:poly [ADP-ribose] polymerase
LETKEVKSLEEKKTGVKGVGRKTTDESDHFTWRDDVKVPCGKLVPSGNKDGPLEYNEFAVYDPKQVNRWCITRCSVYLTSIGFGDHSGYSLTMPFLVVQVSIQFLVAVRYEEQNMELVPDE